MCTEHFPKAFTTISHNNNDNNNNNNNNNNDKQILHIMNNQNRGLSHLPKPKAEADNRHEV